MEARDAPSEGSVDSDERVGPAQLEELITDIVFDQTSSKSPSVVRDIYFHPGNTQVSIGLQVEIKDGYPIIVAVESVSPLVGRVFCGDCILALNDMDGNTFSPEETLAVLEAGLMVKDTIISMEEADSIPLPLLT